MVAEACSLRVIDHTQTPVSEVTLRVFSGSTSVTWGVTETDGTLDLLLDEGTYTVRGYKPGVSFGPPFEFDVTAGEDNEYDLPVDVAAAPVPRDARICILRGYVLNGFGAPAPNVDIMLWLEEPPTILGENLVIGSTVAVRTDATGYVEIPLVRTASYRFTLQGVREHGGLFEVPDTATANLADVLYPEISEVRWEDTPITLAVDEELTVYPQVYTFAGVLLDGSARTYLTWSSSDSDIVTVAPVEDGLVLTGISAGSATISAVRATPSDGKVLVPHIPDVVIEGLPQSVEVS